VNDLDVLVIGGGPVGLSAGLQLAAQGLRTFVAERRDTLSRHPKAAGIHAPTMELFAQWGVADQIRAQGLPAQRCRGFSWTTRLIGGQDLGHVLFGDPPEPGPSPVNLVFTPQNLVEPILHAELLRHPSAGFAFDTIAEVLDQDSDGVTVALTDRAASRTVRAAYVIAADGVRSLTRTRLGITETGGPTYGESVNIYFASDDLAGATANSPYSVTWVANPEVTGAFSPQGRGNRWSFNFAAEPGIDYDNATSLRKVREAIGDPDVAVELLSVLQWKHEAAVADSWRVGRVLLAGDAAHRFPPHGGFGMNSGIQDSANLCWKLARVLDGTADDALLDTYEQERRPVAEFNSEQCTRNTQTMAETGWLAEDPAMMANIERPEGAALRERIRAAVPAHQAQLNSVGQQFGYQYHSDAVISDGSVPDPSSATDYRPSARPGARMPHLWLRDSAGKRYSTVDLPAGRFAVIAGRSGQHWADAARGLRLSAWVIGSDLTAEQSDFEKVYGIKENGAVLVRPDRHVALRVPTETTDCTHTLSTALHEILGR
jgi:2-polyprenyl-6-methoxyphenol hydroxylase-like FAD-dependent oxidoreductase